MYVFKISIWNKTSPSKLIGLIFIDVFLLGKGSDLIKINLLTLTLGHTSEETEKFWDSNYFSCIKCLRYYPIIQVYLWVTFYDSESNNHFASQYWEILFFILALLQYKTNIIFICKKKIDILLNCIKIFLFQIIVYCWHFHYSSRQWPHLENMRSSIDVDHHQIFVMLEKRW